MKFRIPKVIPDIFNRVTGRWAPPGTGDSKGKQRLYLEDDPRDKEQVRKEAERRYRRGGKSEGLERAMVPKAEFSSYYGRPIVKAPPWGWPIGLYLWLGGIGGGSGVLSLGAQLTGNEQLRRSTGLSAFGAAAVGSLALVGDLGRPERALNMFRVFKVTSPMSMGSYLLFAFASASALPAAYEITNNVAGVRRVVPAWMRSLLKPAADIATPITGVTGPLLATYTGVLFADTSVPAWHNAGEKLPVIFGSSGALAAGGAAMVLTPPEKAGPARAMALLGTAAEVASMHSMKEEINPTVREVYESDHPGTLLKLSEACVIAGAAGTALASVLQRCGKKTRALSVLSGAALVGGSALTRFGILHAGHMSVRDPKYVVAPQKQRMEEDRAQGRVSENITTLS